MKTYEVNENRKSKLQIIRKTILINWLSSNYTQIV